MCAAVKEEEGKDRFVPKKKEKCPLPILMQQKGKRRRNIALPGVEKGWKKEKKGLLIARGGGKRRGKDKKGNCITRWSKGKKN